MIAKNCLNCEHKVYGNYCSNCGQSIHTHRLNWHYVWHDLPHSFFHVDKGILFTAKELTLRPGKTINAFLAGKRTAYFRPLMYLIITGTIAGLIHFNAPGGSAFARDEQTQQIMQGMSSFQGKYFNFITIGFLPFQALLTWLFYRRERNYVEIFFSLCYVIGHLNLLAFLVLIGYAWNSPTVNSLISFITILLGITYFIVSYYQQFPKLKKWKRIIFPFFIQSLTSIFLLILTFMAYLYYVSYQTTSGEVLIDYGF